VHIKSEDQLSKFYQKHCGGRVLPPSKDLTKFCVFLMNVALTKQAWWILYPIVFAQVHIQRHEYSAYFG